MPQTWSKLCPRPAAVFQLSNFAPLQSKSKSAAQIASPTSAPACAHRNLQARFAASGRRGRANAGTFGADIAGAEIAAPEIAFGAGVRDIGRIAVASSGTLRRGIHSSKILAPDMDEILIFRYQNGNPFVSAEGARLCAFIVSNPLQSLQRSPRSRIVVFPHR
jgi:hypothetical protein